jgi:alkylation response protein AidB-like acyl-CoA dehydrogenase
VHCTRNGVAGDCSALVPLSGPGVVLHDDWDVMGRRGTRSQTITYQDVFVPDGWHYRPSGLTPLFLACATQLHAALMDGIADGAFRATLAHAGRPTHRSILPGYPNAGHDPLMQREVGELATTLAASRALLLGAANQVGQPGADPDDIRLLSFQAKVFAVRTALDVTGRMHDLSGARPTASGWIVTGATPGPSPATTRLMPSWPSSAPLCLPAPRRIWPRSSALDRRDSEFGSVDAAPAG